MYINQNIIQQSGKTKDVFQQITIVNHNSIELAKLIGFSWISYSPNQEESSTTFIFREENNELLVVDEGIVKKGHWEQLVLSNSILINNGDQELLFNVIYFGNVGFILKKENLDEYLILIKRGKNKLQEKPLEEVVNALMEDYNKIQKQFDNINLEGPDSQLEFEDLGEFREYKLFPYVATLGSILIVLTVIILFISRFWEA